MSIEDERAQVWKAIGITDDRVTQLREDMRITVRDAVREAMPTALMSDDEHRWVKLAIEKEAQSIRFRQAIIEKTLAGILWALIVGVGASAWLLLREYAVAHGMWKP